MFFYLNNLQAINKIMNRIVQIRNNLSEKAAKIARLITFTTENNPCFSQISQINTDIKALS